MKSVTGLRSRIATEKSSDESTPYAARTTSTFLHPFFNGIALVKLMIPIVEIDLFEKSFDLSVVLEHLAAQTMRISIDLHSAKVKDDGRQFVVRLHWPS